MLCESFKARIGFKNRHSRNQSNIQENTPNSELTRKLLKRGTLCLRVRLFGHGCTGFNAHIGIFHIVKESRF
jgi:hypothetical protein